MPSTIVMNMNNLVQDGLNSTLVYKFPTSIQLSKHEIAVQSVSMYNSISNINVAQNNNRFTYTWTVGSTLTTYTVLIPDGLYQISDINKYLQFVMIQNGHYLIDSLGKNIYFVELLVNATRYGIQLNTFPVPTSLPVGYTQPLANPSTGALAFAGYPTTSITPVVTFPANFSRIVGFADNFVSTTSGSLNMSFLSTTSPQVQPNPTIFLALTNINNQYAQPSTIIYSLSPSVDLGQKIVEVIPEYAYNKLTGGTYTELRLQLLGANFQPLKILDPNIVILLIIREV